MALIETIEVEREVDEETDVHVNFVTYDRLDPIELRSKLGLDGSTALNLTAHEKSQIATRLWRNQLINKEEIDLLGGKIISGNEHSVEKEIV